MGQDLTGVKPCLWEYVTLSLETAKQVLIIAS